MRVMMNSDSMPKELDVFISLLGEIDMIKNQVGMLDKNTHIVLSGDNVNAILGNAECFHILKLIESLNANLSALNASLLNAAQQVTLQYSGSEDFEGNLESKNEDQPKNEKDNEAGQAENKKDNEVINNMLHYFKERFNDESGQ